MPTGLFNGARRDRVAVVEADPDLADRLSGTRSARAQRLSVAAVLHRGAGRWRAKEDAESARDGLGLLVVEGLLVRRVGLSGRFSAELLSDGDLLQPSEHDGEEATLPFEATWRVLSPLRLAVLNLDWMNRMAPFPEVVAALTRRVMVRSRRLGSMLAIAQHHRLEDRLRLCFWELADRYGRVCREGVRLELALTHELIGHLVGAHRPSVSVALARLDRSGEIRRTGDGWLLRGGPPSLEDVVRDNEHPAIDPAA